MLRERRLALSLLLSRQGDPAPASLPRVQNAARALRAL
jgi:hypothetical protein